MLNLPTPNITWISGWSVPSPFFLDAARRAWPNATHSVLDPSPKAIACATASDAQILGGYSFGANILLSVYDPRPRILLAPFLDLKLESKLGGAIATTQIKQLLRWIKRDRNSALADFHSRIGLTQSPSTTSLDLDDLAWGLEQMLSQSTPPTPLPPKSLLIAGANDPLLDMTCLPQFLPSLQIINSDHRPLPLLTAAANLYNQ